MVTEFKSLAQKSDEEIVASQKRVRDDQAKLSDRRFKFGEEDKGPQQQFRDYMARAGDLGRVSWHEPYTSYAGGQRWNIRQNGPPRQPEDIQQDMQRLKRAEQFAEEAKAIAARQHDTAGVRDAEAEVERIMAGEITLEKQLQSAEKQRQRGRRQGRRQGGRERRTDAVVDEEHHEGDNLRQRQGRAA